MSDPRERLSERPGWAAITQRAVETAERDRRVVALTIGGSATVGETDEFSDLDFVVVCRDDGHAALLAEAERFAKRLGPQLASFTGEHVNEPRLLICLYGPPLLHVDLKFVRLSDLITRVENGLILWERVPDTLAQATAGTSADWPLPNLQWLEDRFWVWVHSVASKIGRGELFECLEAYAYFRSAIFGPLLAVQHNRMQGVRRLERYAGDALHELEQSVGDHTRGGCIRALRASIALYTRLRNEGDDGTVIRRTRAELASIDYFDEIARPRRARRAGQASPGQLG